MADYDYDVFVSYETDHLMTRWIAREFMPPFVALLRAAIPDKTGRDATRVFFAHREEQFPGLFADYKMPVVGIPAGAEWEPALDSAIRTSRCMLGLWAPPYFRSSYCIREWYSFRHRVEATGKSVVLGASWYDGNSFPEEAKRLQMVNISRFAPNFGLENGKSYDEFRQVVQILAERVADAVRDAPPFQEWPIKNGPPPPAPAPILLPRL